MTHAHWSEVYVGIPYLSKGRDRAGLDCWGLVRLVHAERFGCELPSFEGTYTDATDGAAAAEALAVHREGWAPVDAPVEGDVALFRVFGAEAHVGVVLDADTFLHARAGHGVAVERFDSPQWRHRLVGFFRYAPGVAVVGCPHPLQTRRVEVVVSAGATVLDIVRQFGVSEELLSHGHAWVNSKPVAFADWAHVIPAPGARVEFRVVAQGGDFLRSVLTIALIVAAAWVAGPAGTAALGSQTAATIAAAAISVAGTMLINAIAPIRPPSAPEGFRQERKWDVAGGSNASVPYSAIPVVLGAHRYSAPLAAEPYLEALGGERYLRLLLCWGYGYLEVSDLRIGETRLTDYEEVQLITVGGHPSDDLTELHKIYGQDVDEESVGISLEYADGWITRTSAEEAEQLDLIITWPQGLGAQSVKSGKKLERNGQIDVEYRQVKDAAGNAVAGPWENVDGNSVSGTTQVFQLMTAYADDSPRGFFNVGDNLSYRWAVFVGSQSGVDLYEGPAFSDPNAASVETWVSNAGGEYPDRVNVPVIPAIGPKQVELWRVRVYGNTVDTVQDKRPSGTAGMDLSLSGLQATITGGRYASITNAIDVTKSTMIAFDTPVSIRVARGQYEVRVRRADDDKRYEGQDDPSWLTSVWQTLRSTTNRRPVTPPKPLALTALRMRASNQINGTIESISGMLKSVCLSWNGTAWVGRATSNPADLFRYVLQHPANARPVPDSEIDLPALQAWATFCASKGFQFNMVLTEQRSLLEVLKDVCAAGRASPTMRDSKWSVVVDEPRATVVQHFTPHNSWGFEGTRVLPKRPDAFRVEFYNGARDFIRDEIVVYDDGKNAGNSSLFESIGLPGVTTATQAFKLGRFHMAQMQLRSEEYVLSVDAEHLICTRGDRVRVTHDVPMWGLGTGRVKSIEGDVSGITLDEDVPMDAGATYAVRWRTETGASGVATLVPALEDGYYRTLTFVSAVTVDKPAPGDLVMFGTLDAESVDCLVKSIEPTGQCTARLTLVDYAPGVYTADSAPIPDWESKISLPPKLERFKVNAVPTLKSVDSGTRALVRDSGGGVAASMLVAFSNPARLPVDVDAVDCQLSVAGRDDWIPASPVDIRTGQIRFEDVTEGRAYDVRMRYVTRAGVAGPWARVVSAHEVVGKSEPPTEVTGLVWRPDGQGGGLLDWSDTGDLDLRDYEIRRGTGPWDSLSTTATVMASQFALQALVVGAYTYQVRARDTGLRFSAVSATVSFSIAGPGAVGGLSVTHGPLSSSLSWSAVALGSNALKHYRIERAGVVLGYAGGTSFPLGSLNPGAYTFSVVAVDVAGHEGGAASVATTVVLDVPDTLSVVLSGSTLLMDWADGSSTYRLEGYDVLVDGAVVARVKSSQWSTQAMWAGLRRFGVRPVDATGNVGALTERSMTVEVPGPVQSLTSEVVDNNVLLRWQPPASGSLPIKTYRLLKSKTDLGSATEVGQVNGLFTALFEMSAGAYSYWVIAIDTADNLGVTGSPTLATVAQPPDYVLAFDLVSDFSGAKVNAMVI